MIYKDAIMCDYYMIYDYKIYGYILKEEPYRDCLPLNFEIIKVLFEEDFKKLLEYSGTSLKWTLKGQKFLSALERCPSWRGLI